MKKIFLSVAFAAIAMSCQEKTKEKLEEAKDAIGTEVEQKIIASAVKTINKLI